MAKRQLPQGIGLVGKCDWCAKDIGGLRDIARTCSAACKQAMHRWRNDSLWIHPFERTDGGAAEWVPGATAEDYRWGEAAVAIGQHFDKQEDAEGEKRYSEYSLWYDELVELELDLIAHANDETGQRCMFNKGNNPNGLPRWD